MSSGGGRGRSPSRSSSGRVIKQNSKYGEIQGRAFERVVQRIVGPDPLSDDEYDSESAAPAGSEEEQEQPETTTLGADLEPDDVCRCLVCWSACTPAPAAADAYNKLNRYLATHGDSPVQMVVGALGLNLDAAAKFELICPSCASLVRELEQREQQVEQLRQQLLERFSSSRQQLPLQTQQQLDQQQQALLALRADGQDGMFGVTGLGVPLPEPPAPARRAARGARPAGDPLPREEDTVEAYLSRRDEWITQTPGAATGLVRAMVEASADGMGTRTGPTTDPHPCAECERVFASAEALARHEYFQHQVGELQMPEGKDEEPAAVAVEVVMEEPPVDESGMDESAVDEGADEAGEEEETGEDDGEDAEGEGEETAAAVSARPPGKRRRGRPRLPDSLALRSGSCQYCGTFIKVDLQGHINRFHTMVRPHQCQLCGQRLVSRHALAEHRQVAHSSGRPCDHCGATFARKKQLSMHMWRKHGVGGVQCRICGKKFARSDTLDGHMRCHERPMQCSLCPARFPFKRELRNHEHLKHGLHGEIPRDSDYRPGEMYRCGKCGRCFGSWAGRDRHTCESSAALSDLYVCQLCGDWSTRFEGDMVKHMRNLHEIEAETILIADVEEEAGQEDAAVGEDAAEVDDPGMDGEVVAAAQLVQVEHQ